jgi:predicted ATPase
VLRLRGEHDYPVPPLTVPEESLYSDTREDIILALEQFETVRLLIDRAASVKPGFIITRENARSIAEICHRLDGLPLAIELAVSHMRYLTPQAILRRLQQKLPVLGKGAIDLPDRQRTLESTIEWSHNLLNDDEKTLFRRLSIFVGGFALEAAEEVCNSIAGNSLTIDVFDNVGSLVEKNLLKEEEIGGESWFYMLETIREYAGKRLKECEEIDGLKRRHAEFYMKLANQARVDLRGPYQVVCLHRLNREIDNIRSALTWGMNEGDPQVAAKTAASLWWFFFRAGVFSEGYERLFNLSEIKTVMADETRAELTFGAAFIAAIQGNYSVAESLAGRARSLAQDSEIATCVAWAHWVSFTIPFLQNNIGLMIEKADDTLSRIRQSEDKACIAEASRLFGWAVGVAGDFEKSELFFEAGLKLFRELGDKRGIGISHMNHAQSLIKRGEYRRPRAMINESLLLAREAGEKWNVAHCLEILGSLEVLANSHPRRACILFGASQRMFEDMGAILPPVEATLHVQSITAARAVLDEEAFETAWHEGWEMKFDQALEYALKVVSETDAPDPG